MRWKALSVVAAKMGMKCEMLQHYDDVCDLRRHNLIQVQCLNLSEVLQSFRLPAAGEKFCEMLRKAAKAGKTK